MKPRLLLTLLCSLCLLPTGFAAEEADKKQASEEEIKARLAEHAARKDAAAKADAEAAAKTQAREENAAAISASPAKEQAAASLDEQPATAPARAPETAQSKENDAPTVLPRVDVRKDKITELDQQLAKQNRAIAREKENTKPTALDEALNGPKTSKLFGLFGGQSSDDRSNIAKERVAMMEEEKEIMEAIAQAETKEEKEQLQKVLDSMKATRRELEHSLR